MLDIKLKNNRKYSLIAAGVIIAIAVTGFLASYPILGDRVQKNFSDNAIGSELLEQIYRSNLVLYKDLYDRIHQENVDYAKLYMQITEEELTAGEINIRTFICIRNITINIFDFAPCILNFFLRFMVNHKVVYPLG